MKCPYCDSEIEDNIPICPHCMAELHKNVKVVQINTSGLNKEANIQVENKSKSYTKYYVIIGIMTVILLSLVGLIAFKMKPEKKDEDVTKETKTTSVVEKNMTLNKGVFSGKENPLSFGNMTIASLYDKEADEAKFVDVMITRYLSDAEVAGILANNNQILNEGFTFVGVEYNVYFHDHAYLEGRTLSPVLDVSILENKLFNDYFLINGHYYRNDVISAYDGPNIKNEESATVQIVYQVPISEKYYICFGSDSSSLGCFTG